MNRKKIFLARSLKILMLLIPVVLFVLYLPINCQEDTLRIQGYRLEEENSLDVVFMGASDVYAGYSPVLAYEEFGFTGYTYVLSGNHIELIPGQLNDLLRTQKPKLIVIEITELIKGSGIHDPRLYQYLAGTPFSRNKLEMIWDYGIRENCLTYLFPFSVNHGSSDLATILSEYRSAAMMRDRGYTVLKGSMTFTGSGENWDGPYVTPINTSNDLSRREIPGDVEAKFRNLLSHLREQGHGNIVFVNFPHRITTEEMYHRYQFTNTLGDLIESYGYDFYNLETQSDAIGIQPETDFYNNTHMNLYGQYKVTRYLANLFRTRYGIGETRLSPENRQRWETCVDYQHLYYDLFDYEFKNRDPEEFGMWMKEEAWLIEKLDSLRSDPLPRS